ncbi:MAG TPA: MarR family transcriptional regulator [Petrotogaceae bacterium]|jgi:DNA-binding MarR family transcriptional regulator|nr:MarR family transcriptional regulator [Petrotogaceae bacterium]
MDKKKVHTQLMEYYQIFKETDAIYNRLAKRAGLAESAYWVIYSIRMMDGRCTQKEICSQWSLSKQTVNSGLKYLEKEGLIMLAEFSEDRRSKEILLTENGEKFSKKYIDTVFEMEMETFEKMSDRERKGLIDSSRRYRDLLQKQADSFLDRQV